MKKNNFKNRHKPGDYVGTCDTCGQLFWASAGHVLDKYTGNGGAWVCPTCNDKIHYGLVPFIVEAEKEVPISRAAPFNDTTQTTITIDFTQSPPKAS